jgi:hypothetical protein
MPTVRKLTPEEIRAIQQGKSYKEPSQRKQVAAEYDAYLADMHPGDVADVDLAEDDNRLTVANRLKAAAQRRGVILRFRRASGNQLRFEVAALDA